MFKYFSTRGFIISDMGGLSYGNKYVINAPALAPVRQRYTPKMNSQSSSNISDTPYKTLQTLKYQFQPDATIVPTHIWNGQNTSMKRV